MGTWTFDLDFRGGDVTAGQLPGAVAHISLKNHSLDDSGVIHVSHQCMGPTEVEAEVKRLKAELDEIAKRGRQKFHRYEADTVKAIEEKRR